MISNNNIKKHYESCGRTDKIVQVDENWRTTEGKYKCPLCYKDFSKYGISNHIKVTHFRMKHTNGMTGKQAWNKGLTKETDDRVLKNSNSISKTTQKKILNGTFVKTGFATDEYWSNEKREKQSKIAIDREFGGVRPSKKIEYNGVMLGSSYEVTLAKDLDKHNIKWEVPKRLPYVDCNGKSRYYTPDFYLPEYDIFLEPKNDFLIENVNPNLGFKDTDKIRWCEEQNNIKVILLNKNELSWESVCKIKNMVGVAE